MDGVIDTQRALRDARDSNAYGVLDLPLESDEFEAEPGKVHVERLALDLFRNPSHDVGNR
jgi:hypothetical protein